MTCNVKLSKGKNTRFENDIYMEEHDARNFEDCRSAYEVLATGWPGWKVEYIFNTN